MKASKPNKLGSSNGTNVLVEKKQPRKLPPLQHQHIQAKHQQQINAGSAKQGGKLKHLDHSPKRDINAIETKSDGDEVEVSNADKTTDKSFCQQSNKMIIDNRLQSIPIQKLPDMLDAVYADGRYTPLILDESGRVDTFFTYATNTSVLSVKGYLVRVDVQHTQTIDEAREDLRQRLISALKYGKQLVLAFEDSAVNLAGKYADPTFFPPQCLLQAGRMFRERPELYEPCLRRPADYEPYGVFVAREEFRLLLTSRFSAEDYQEFFSGCFPDLAVNYLPINIEINT